MNSAYGSSGSFESIVRSKFIGNNTYTGRRGNFHSKPIPINGPVHKYFYFFHTREVTSVGYHKKFLKC